MPNKKLKTKKIDITKTLLVIQKQRQLTCQQWLRATGIPYTALYTSLGDKNRDRPLSVDEAFLVCKFLGEKVEDFAEEKEVV